MKSDEARNLISGIGDSFISEAMPERFRRHHVIQRGWIAAAACFAVIVGIIGGVLYAAALRLPDIEGKLEQKKTVFSTITDTIGISAVTAPAIVFDCPGVKYRSSYYLGQTEPTSANAIGNRLDTALSESGEEIGIYRINGYSSDYAIALRRDGDADAALYINAGYAPATLGGLLRDIGLDSTPVPFIMSAYYLYKDADGAQHTAEFEVTDGTEVLKRLFSDTDAKMLTDGTDPDAMLIISVGMSALGNQKAVFRITAEGLVTVMLPGVRTAFNIGKLRARSLARYIAQNFNGCELVAGEN